MTIDVIIGKMLEGGAPYAVLAALLVFVFKPPKWFTKIIDTMIDNSKTRAASFERLLAAIHDLEQALMTQIQVLERNAAEHLLRDQERHEKLMLQVERVGHLDRHAERNKSQVVIGEIYAARDQILAKLEGAE